MLCPNCGHNNADESAFCLQCGNKLNAETESAQPANPATPSADQKKSKKDIFVSEDEYAVATLKNGMAVHLITGEGLFGEKAIVSNKRVYYRNLRVGLNMGMSAKAIAANDSDSGDFVVDIKDVTGTKITQNNPWGLLLLAVILLIGCISNLFFILPALILMVAYFLMKKTQLYVQYAGGVIHFNLRGYSMKNVRAFRNAIYTVKDSLDAKK